MLYEVGNEVIVWEKGPKSRDHRAKSFGAAVGSSGSALSVEAKAV